MLGGDQPRRQVPVHREHGVGQHLQLLHPRRRLTALIGSTPISGGGTDIDARLSPDGKTLSVDGSGNHILSVFAVHGGTLTELPSSPAPLPAGGAPAGIVNIRPARRRSLAARSGRGRRVLAGGRGRAFASAAWPAVSVGSGPWCQPILPPEGPSPRPGLIPNLRVDPVASRHRGAARGWTGPPARVAAAHRPGRAAAAGRPAPDRRTRVDHLAYQATADALLAIVSKLGQFRGESRFTTWAYKFVVLEVSAKIGRHFSRHPSVRWDAEDWDRLPDRFGLEPAREAERKDLADAVRHAVDEQLTARQRQIFVAIVLNGVPLDALAIELGSTRNAIYKTMFDARLKLRAALAANGYLDDETSRPS